MYRVMQDDFGPGSFPDATKDPPSACDDVLVKSVALKGAWSVFNNLPWMLSRKKISLPYRDKSYWRWRWMVLPPYIRREKSHSCRCKMGLASQE